MIEWQDLHHSELSVSQLLCLITTALRGVCCRAELPYQDIDGDDLTGDNRHILGWKNDELVAYARILKSEDDFEPVVIGRVIISGNARGEKLGYQLIGKNAGSVPKTVAGQGVISGRAGAPATVLRAFWVYARDGGVR